MRDKKPFLSVLVNINKISKNVILTESILYYNLYLYENAKDTNLLNTLEGLKRIQGISVRVKNCLN